MRRTTVGAMEWAVAARAAVVLGLLLGAPGAAWAQADEGEELPVVEDEDGDGDEDLPTVDDEDEDDEDLPTVDDEDEDLPTVDDEAEPLPADPDPERQRGVAGEPGDGGDEGSGDDGGEARQTGADTFQLRAVDVTYTQDDLFREGGSVQRVDQKTLEAQEHDDPGRILLQVPGVYLRQEDGYGLRPNIGLRGANSERSKKIALMEDGVLFGPAPYSAPAAYYFPMMTRLVGVDVFKGPSAIMYGPNTIGGAVNLTTRAVPYGLGAELDGAYGMNAYAKGHGWVGWSNEVGGVLAEVAHIQADGFKELDGGGDTGFARTDVMVKGTLNADLTDDVFQKITLKLTYSGEVSNETYLGLSDEDFRANPNRRYASTALGRMAWERFSGVLTHSLAFEDLVEVHTNLYRHDFTRAWRKLNGFAIESAPSLSAILADPSPTSIRGVYFDILTGQANSTEGEQLLIGTNDRTFVSQGIQTRARVSATTGEVDHEVEVGLRFHHDRIERDHSDRRYDMEDGELVRPDMVLEEETGLVRDVGETRTTARNVGETFAFAGYLRYGLVWDRLHVSPGVRVEVMHTRFEDLLDDTHSDRDQYAILPGLGLSYEVVDGLRVLAGVHRGFSPVSPGQSADVQPEEAWNVEAGLRYVREDSATLVEAVGFYSAYQNLTGECTFSAGCLEEELDQQFNAGAADIAGVEFVAAHTLDFGPVHVPLRLTYTFTHTAFRTGFVSDNPQFGKVEEGDALPYVPAHQLSLNAGVEMPRWNLFVTGTYASAMREAAGQGDDDPMTDEVVFLDANASVVLFDRLRLYVRAENLLMQDTLVSRRPFGARPGRPFTFQAGLKVRL